MQQVGEKRHTTNLDLGEFDLTVLFALFISKLNRTWNQITNTQVQNKRKVGFRQKRTNGIQLK
jgi:hypothetical protein